MQNSTVDWPEPWRPVYDEANDGELQAVWAYTTIDELISRIARHQVER